MFRLPPALKHRGFALIWGGLIISMVGIANAAMGFVLAYQPAEQGPDRCQHCRRGQVCSCSLSFH